MILSIERKVEYVRCAGGGQFIDETSAQSQRLYEIENRGPAEISQEISAGFRYHDAPLVPFAHATASVRPVIRDDAANPRVLP
ncbi:hypothetical protein [Paraburkholderia graminis]|uniref:hypothetical protein n=1 Tax=Paraburkholderia graminis TaxID=60548 RepID=UPI0012907BC7|nr:hypothetical protein [Paraburkholderia graminis]